MLIKVAAGAHGACESEIKCLKKYSKHFPDEHEQAERPGCGGAAPVSAACLKCTTRHDDKECNYSSLRAEQSGSKSDAIIQSLILHVL